MPRAAFPPPTHADGAVHISGPRQIAFWHPGYATPPATPFLVLAAYEASTFHHETARLACAGIANNRTDGFLSTDVEGRSPVGSDPDLQLALDNYYFQVPDSRSEDWQNVVGSSGTDKTLCTDYSIFADFSDYTYSHLPAYWRRVNVLAAPQLDLTPSATRESCLRRDESRCRLSNERGIVQAAHVIPRSEDGWSGSRGMRRYGAYDSCENAVTLRTDLHQFFDAKHFAIVPRTKSNPSEDSGETRNLYACMLTRDCGLEMARVYHDVELQPLRGVPLEFVWCRFIWAIMGIVQRSINLNLKRRLLRWDVATSSTKITEETYVKPKSRAPSPTKSRASSPQKRDADGQLISRKRSFSQYSTNSSDQSSVFDNDVSLDEDDEGELRGRRKQRQCSRFSNLSAQTSFESLKSQLATVTSPDKHDLRNLI